MLLENKIYLDEEGYEEFINIYNNSLTNLGRIEEKISELRKIKYDKNELTDVVFLKEQQQNLVNQYKNKMSKIIEISKHNIKDRVDIGDTVYIKYDDEDEIESFIITANDISSKALTDSTKMSINSPIGRKIYMSKINDKIKLDIGNYKVEVDIIKIDKPKRLIKGK